MKFHLHKLTPHDYATAQNNMLFSRKVGFINGQWLMLWIIQCHNATLQVHFVTDVMTVRQYKLHGTFFRKT